MFRGKKYKDNAKLIDRATQYEVPAAMDLVVKTASAKFDETVEVHIKLGVDSRHADQQVRGAIVLPNGTGKTRKVLVFAKDAKLDEAKEAGADFAGGMELVEKIQKENWFDFDVVVATPDMMGLAGRVARVLGPKGLMPNPKLGTVTTDVANAVKKAKAGEVQFRVEKNGIVHAGIAKASFSEDKIYDNAKTFIETILKAKPQSLKGTYLKKISISSTMGVGVRVDASAL